MRTNCKQPSKEQLNYFGPCGMEVHALNGERHNPRDKDDDDDEDEEEKEEEEDDEEEEE